MINIAGRSILSAEPISKGWSRDQKFRVETSEGEVLFLRIADIAEYGKLQADSATLVRLHSSGVPTPYILETGICNDGQQCYSLAEWLSGLDAEDALKSMSDTEQYALGYKAGEILRQIHSLVVEESLSDWQQRYFSVIDERITAYRTEGLPFEGSDVILDYLERNRGLLRERPQCFIHGDYHEGNLLLTPEGDLIVIDLLDEGFGNQGDPWYDLKTFGENENAFFATGMVRGYFGGEPPTVFWRILTYYIVTAALTAIVWTKHNNPVELAETIAWNEYNAEQLSRGLSPIMKWYLSEFCVQWADGIPYKLKRPFGFSFLSQYGRVFKIFDDQDSGNICFGVAKDDRHYFIKYAGAPTERGAVNTEEAILRMKNSVDIYRDLAHPTLTELIAAGEIGDGYAMIFEWIDGECMGRQYPQSRERFMLLPVAEKLRVYDAILSFQVHVEQQGYVAIDFYDGSVMYDFGRGVTKVCDIEFYTKKPYTNQMGRMWGSTRFMSPEEFTLGAIIDEVTNVYTMGATAFALFGGERDRGNDKWMLSPELYAVAIKAVSDSRQERQPSVQQYRNEWQKALEKLESNGISGSSFSAD